MVCLTIGKLGLLSVGILVTVEGCWYKQSGCKTQNKLIKWNWVNGLLRLSWNKGDEGLHSPWRLGWDYMFIRGTCYRKARATQTARGSSQMHLNLILTLHRYHKPIHLTDSSMASSARGCDIADIGVCPPHAHTHYWNLMMLLLDHIWRRGNMICVHILGGRCRKDKWGPFT